MTTTIRDLLERAMMTMSGRELARRLHVSEAAIRAVRGGQRSGLGNVAAGLLAAYPEWRSEILEAMGFTGRAS